MSEPSFGTPKMTKILLVVAGLALGGVGGWNVRGLDPGVPGVAPQADTADLHAVRAALRAEYAKPLVVEINATTNELRDITPLSDLLAAWGVPHRAEAENFVMFRILRAYQAGKSELAGEQPADPPIVEPEQPDKPKLMDALSSD